ncbi:hypothetical protein JCM3770_005240 [Rhodotorula araucariae]
MEWEDNWVKQARELAIKEFAPYKAAHNASVVEHCPKCPAEVGDAAQATLEALGITSANTLSADEVIQTLVHWISENGRLFRIVSYPQLRKLFSPLVTRVLSKNTPRRISDAMSELYKLMQPVVKAKLDPIAGLPRRLTENHTAEYLTEVIYSLIHQYGLKDRLNGICSDNDSSMAKAMELLSEKGLRYFDGVPPWLHCFAHILDIVIKAILRNSSKNDQDTAEDDDFEPSFDETLKAFWRDTATYDVDGVDSALDLHVDVNKLSDAAFERLREEIIERLMEEINEFQALAKRLRYSGVACRAWAETALRLGVSAKHVPRAVKTHWNTVLDQCEAVHEVQALIWAYQQTRVAGVKPAMRLTQEDIKVASDLVTLLKPLRDLTRVVTKAHSGRVGSYPAGLHNAALKGWSVLQKYYAYTDDSKFYRIGVLLHPLLHLLYFRTAEWKEEWINQACKILKTEFEPDRIAYEASIAKSKSANALHASAAPTDNLDPVEAFITAAPEVDGAGALLDAWAHWIAEKKAGREHNGLTELALDIFCAPVSGVPVERSFSVGRHLVAEKRHACCG